METERQDEMKEHNKRVLKPSVSQEDDRAKKEDKGRNEREI